MTAPEQSTGPHATVVDVVVMSLHLSPEQAARAVEVLSRAVLGLALDGVDASLRVDHAECACDEDDSEVAP